MQRPDTIIEIHRERVQDQTVEMFGGDKYIEAVDGPGYSATATLDLTLDRVWFVFHDRHSSSSLEPNLYAANRSAGLGLLLDGVPLAAAVRAHPGLRFAGRAAEGRRGVAALVDETVVAVAAGFESIPVPGLRQLNHRGQYGSERPGETRLGRGRTGVDRILSAGVGRVGGALGSPARSPQIAGG